MIISEIAIKEILEIQRGSALCEAEKKERD